MRRLGLIAGKLLVLGSLLVFMLPGLAMAAENDALEEPQDLLILSANYPKVEGIAGAIFEFEVDITYRPAGENLPKNFELDVTGPQGWDTHITPNYQEEKKISAILMDPGSSSVETLRAVATAPFWPLPEPGEYDIVFEITSEDLSASIVLKAVVTARHALAIGPVDERYNTNVKPGQENYYSIEIVNLSTVPVDDFKVTATKPEGWKIEFTPEKIEQIAAFDSQNMEVMIMPPAETIAGDYTMTLRGTSSQTASDDISVRVTVETPTIWGWVGVGVIVVVLAGLIFVFMRFSRR
ncbi:NEW3 domain-containing protein [Chloroflexota bacterium]